MRRIILFIVLTALFFCLNAAVFAADKQYGYTLDYSAIPSDIFKKQITIIVNVGTASSCLVTADGTAVANTYSSGTGNCTFSITQTAASILVTAVNWTAGGTGAATKATLFGDKKWAYSFTFDDNYAADYTLVYPYFSARGLRGGIGVVPNWIGGGYLTRAQLDALFNAGWSIINHSTSHPQGTIACGNLATYVGAAKTTLESWYPANYKNIYYIYPYLETGYQACLSTAGYVRGAECGDGTNYVDNFGAIGFYNLYRHGLYANVTAAQANAWADAANSDARPRWVITFTHNTVAGSGTPGTYDTNEATLLTGHINYVYTTYGAGGATNNMWFAPSDEVLMYLFTRQYLVINTAVLGTPSRTPSNTPYAGTPTFTRTATQTQTNTATPNSILLDDMEDGNNINNWGGNWYSYSGTGTTITPKPFVMTAGGMTGSPNYRAQIIATVADYGGLGTDLNSGSTAVDLTNYTAVEFWVKGNGGTNYWFQFTQPSITDGDNFGVTFTAPAAWTKVTVPINAGSLTQRGYGAASTFTKNAIAALQWASNANGALDIEIDNVVLLTSVAMSPTFTLTKTPGTTFTFTRTPSATASVSPTFTSTRTPTNSVLPTSSVSPLNTSTRTPSSTPTFTGSNTPVNTATGSPANTPTFTRTATSTFTPVIVPSFTVTPSITVTFTRTATATSTRTNTPAVSTATFTPTTSGSAVFANGADVGWLSQMESSGKKFYNDSGVQQDCLQILKDHCINSIRLRVWVNPTGGWCGKTDVINMAVRAKNMGFRIMIDFHYSDSWADPGQQTIPAAWAAYTHAQLVTAVYDHTYDVISSLVAAGVTPEWVQVGNETNNGMLWEDGRASVSMANYAQLTASGYDAVKAASPSSKVIVHVSNGYDNALFRWIFDGLKNNGGKWDVIGMSLYPDPATWATLTAQCLTNMNDMIARYPGKEVMISEIGMDYTQAAATHDLLVDIINKVKSLPGGKGLGVFYWEPECYSWQGYGKGAFDTTGKPTIAMDAFAENCPMPMPTNTASPQVSATRTATPSSTRTATSTWTRTLTPSASASATASVSPKSTFTITITLTRYTLTATPTRTLTMAVPTATWTQTIIYTPSCPMIWSDEFTGPNIDASKWVFETGAGGWGNNELENYTSRTQNARIESGELVIEALQETYGGSNYTSARIKTQTKFSHRYGRVEARIKLPYGQGIWPAFWMLGQDIPTAGWPACGEIDIMEMIGGGAGRDDTVYGTAHWDAGGHASYGGSKRLASGIFADDYHIFGIEWDSSAIRWYLDGVQYQVIDITPADLAELNQDFFIILNLAVGGTWPGNPDGTTVFPQQMRVDWVRWYDCVPGTPSATASVSPINSYTKTPTMTPTQTPSSVQSSTVTPSRTATSTLTRTATATYTLSASRTTTASSSATPTMTCACTGSFTATRTATIPNPTNTFSATSSFTVTPSRTSTHTRTSTPTRTESPDYSPTETWTGTPPTETITPTITQTETELPTGTITRTMTPTPVNTATPTFTRTRTGTPTFTVTVSSSTTPGNTATFTKTVSATASVSPSNTFTRTPTQTYTASRTPTVTVTSTASRTPSPTASASSVPSVTATPTATLTLTIPETPNPSATASMSQTPSYTSTWTPSFTPTIAWGDKFTIDNTLVYPDPYRPGAGDLKLKITISKPASDLKARIYTAAFRRILEIPAGDAETRDVIITIPQWKFGRLAAGTYYIVISGRAGGNESAASKPAALIIIK